MVIPTARTESDKYSNTAIIRADQIMVFNIGIMAGGLY